RAVSVGAARHKTNGHKPSDERGKEAVVGHFKAPTSGVPKPYSHALKPIRSDWLVNVFLVC
ncbi:MAG: hypothetical protein MUF06_15185, partial [Pirellulaceae bacterium]|nr:hypothetical protein [Pirellulaceae bacterium]